MQAGRCCQSPGSPQISRFASCLLLRPWMSPQLLLLATHLVWGSLGQALGDPCTNLCEEGNPAAWCGARRADASGRVARCTEGTK